MEKFTALIFDLGGVLIDIDYTKTQRAFEALGITNFSELYSQASQQALFDRFETGQISAQHFINQLMHFFNEISFTTSLRITNCGSISRFSN